jgi:hypothetical protein
LYHVYRRIIALLTTILLLSAARPALACPYCTITAGGLADDAASCDARAEEDSTSQPVFSPPKALNISIGVDATTAYFYRGYLQQDRGAIAQPYLIISTRIGDEHGGLNIQPYVSWWNDINEEPNDRVRGGHGRDNHVARIITKTQRVLVPGTPDNPKPHFEDITSESFVAANTGSGEGWYEVELSGGALITYKDWWIDLSYHVHFYPGNTHDAVQELDAKIGYDVAGFWDKKTLPVDRKFSLRPYILVARELQDQNGDENTYIELGVEPSWRFRALNHNFAVSTPLLVGLSPDGLYYNPNGGDETLGYASAAIKGSMGLNIPEKFGHWYINASLTYLQLYADSTIADNRGSHNELIGTIGVGVSF